MAQTRVAQGSHPAAREAPVAHTEWAQGPPLEELALDALLLDEHDTVDW